MSENGPGSAPAADDHAQLADGDVWPGYAPDGPEDAEIVQSLPPLQGVPFSERSALLAFFGQEARRRRQLLAPRLPQWEAIARLDREARRRLITWVQDATRGTTRPVLDLGAGLGLLFRDLAASGAQTVAIDVSWEMCRNEQKVARWAADESYRLAKEAAETIASQPVAWWGGDQVPASQAVVAKALPPRPVVCGDAHDPPFRSGRFGCLLAADVLQHLGEWPHVLKAWHRLLMPGGSLVIATPAEKDQDAPGFLSLLGRTLQPGVITGFPRSQDLTWVLSLAGFDVAATSVFRVRRTFAQIRADFPAPPPVPGSGSIPSDAWRKLIEQASESLRALYEIDSEGMSWRYLLVKATKRESEPEDEFTVT